MEVANLRLTLDVLDAITHIGHAASDDHRRPIFTTIGLNFGADVLEATATDSYILVSNRYEDIQYRGRARPWGTVMVPAEHMRAVTRALHKHLALNGHASMGVRLHAELDLCVTEADDHGHDSRHRGHVAITYGTSFRWALPIVQGEYVGWRQLFVTPDRQHRTTEELRAMDRIEAYEHLNQWHRGALVAAMRERQPKRLANTDDLEVQSKIIPDLSDHSFRKLLGEIEPMPRHEPSRDPVALNPELTQRIVKTVPTRAWRGRIYLITTLYDPLKPIHYALGGSDSPITANWRAAQMPVRL